MRAATIPPMNGFRTALTSLLAAVAGPAALAQDFDPAKAVQQGCDILLEMQESKKKEWPYEGVYRERGAIPIGYHVGGTAICARAMIEAPGYADSKKRVKSVRRALDFILDQLDDKLMASGFKGSYDVRGWGHTYALLFLLRLEARDLVPSKRKKSVKKKIEWLVETLQETEIPQTGGWNYSRRRGYKNSGPASPFMTAPTLQTLFLADARGYEVDPEVVERALATLDGARTDSGGYAYSTPRKPLAGQDEDSLHFMNKRLGAAGRMVVVEATLELAGRGDKARLAAAVDSFFENHKYLKERKQQHGTHIPPGGVAPYYFMFAHRYVAQAIELLPADVRETQRARFLEVLEREAEENGGWNDRVFPRSRNYGTAFGMLALLEPDMDQIPRWGDVPAEPTTPRKTAANASFEGSWRSADGDAHLHVEAERVFMREGEGRLAIWRAQPKDGALLAVDPERHSQQAWSALLVDGQLVLTRDGASILFEKTAQRPAQLTPSPRPMPTDLDAPDALTRDATAATLESLAERAQSTMFSSDSEEHAKSDAMVTAALNQMIDAHGWPDAARFGKQPAEHAATLLNHSSDLSLRLAALPLIEKDAQAGAIDALKFCTAFDATQVMLGLHQHYGTRWQEKDGKRHYQPIADEANVDKRREKLGLPPLER